MLADTIEMSKAYLTRYIAGFDEANSTRQAIHMPNHVRWNIGHIALTMHRVAEKMDGKPVPESDFCAGPSVSRFHTEAVSFGSKPTDDAAKYPPLARCIEIYNAAVDRLAGAARALPDSRLTEPTPWFVGPPMPLYLIVARMAYHNGFHIGQIADLRRALGFRSVFS
jgi:hypothetical protein